jgi:hypothetical protein
MTPSFIEAVVNMLAFVVVTTLAAACMALEANAPFPAPPAGEASP